MLAVRGSFIWLQAINGGEVTKRAHSITYEHWQTQHTHTVHGALVWDYNANVLHKPSTLVLELAQG